MGGFLGLGFGMAIGFAVIFNGTPAAFGLAAVGVVLFSYLAGRKVGAHAQATATAVSVATATSESTAAAQANGGNAEVHIHLADYTPTPTDVAMGWTGQDCLTVGQETSADAVLESAGIEIDSVTGIPVLTDEQEMLDEHERDDDTDSAWF